MHTSLNDAHVRARAPVSTVKRPLPPTSPSPPLQLATARAVHGCCSVPPAWRVRGPALRVSHPGLVHLTRFCHFPVTPAPPSPSPCLPDAPMPRCARVSTMCPRPVSISKDDVQTMIRTQFPFAFDEETRSWILDGAVQPGGATRSGQPGGGSRLHEHDQLTNDTFLGPGFYYWKVPTSILFAVHPVTERLGKKNKAKWNAEKSRWELKVQVYNNVEARNQTEKVTHGKITGVVLRGKEAFGWTSQDDDVNKYPESLYRWECKRIPVKSHEEVPRAIAELARNMRDECEGDPKANFNHVHWEQLNEIVDSCGDAEQSSTLRSIHEQFKKILEEDDTAEFEIVARAYAGASVRVYKHGCVCARALRSHTLRGLRCDSPHAPVGLVGPRVSGAPTMRVGGPLRVTASFDTAVSRFVTLTSRLSNTAVVVPEMWGSNTRRYSEASRTSLMGVEFRGDGQVKYVLLNIGDGSPGETYFRPMLY